MLSEAAQLLLGGAAAKTLLAWGPTPWSDAGASPSTQLSPAAGPVGRNLGARPGTGGCSQLLPAAAPFGGAFPRPRLLAALLGASSAGAGGKARAGKARGRSPWRFPSLRADIFTSLASGVHKPPGQDAPHAKPRSAAARPVSPLPFLPRPGLNGSPNNTWGASQTAGGGWDCKHTQRCFIIFRPQNPFPPFGSTPCLESRLLAAKCAPLGCLLPDPEAEHPVPSQNTLQVEFWLYKSPLLGRWLQPNGSVLLRQECGTAAPDTDPGSAPRCSL